MKTAIILTTEFAFDVITCFPSFCNLHKFFTSYAHENPIEKLLASGCGPNTASARDLMRCKHGRSVMTTPEIE
jgi:hypothetical protein